MIPSLNYREEELLLKRYRDWEIIFITKEYIEYLEMCRSKYEEIQTITWIKVKSRFWYIS